MKVYNIEKTQVMEQYDLASGYLKNDTLTIHHEAVAAVDEQCHYDTVAEYPNGGKDVIKIIDKEGVQGKEAYNEEQEILVYVPYTQEELIKRSEQKELKELEKWFTTYDRVAIEHARCQRLGIACEHNIAELDTQAEQNKARINELRSKNDA